MMMAARGEIYGQSVRVGVAIADYVGARTLEINDQGPESRARARAREDQVLSEMLRLLEVLPDDGRRLVQRLYGIYEESVIAGSHQSPEEPSAPV